MNKALVSGAGLGLLVLLGLGAIWLSASEPAPGSASDKAPLGGAVPQVTRSGQEAGAATAPTAPERAAGSAGTVLEAAPWATPSPTSASASTPGDVSPPKTREQRRQIQRQIRALSTELQAKGAHTSLQDVSVYLDRVERLGEGVFDGRQFATLRLMVDQAAKAQALNHELARLAQSSKPADVARKQEVLAQLRDIGAKISSGAASLQPNASPAAPAR